MDQLLKLLRARCLLFIVVLLVRNLLLLVLCRIRVETELNLPVPKGVLLLDHGAFGDFAAFHRPQHCLNFGAVDKLAEIGLLDNCRREKEVLFQGRGLGCATVNLVERCKSGAGPDDETTKVATGSELQEVESVNGARLDAGDVSEGSDHVFAVVIGIPHDKWTTALPVATASHLALTSSHLARLGYLINIRTSPNALQECDSGGSLGHRECRRGYDERNFWDVRDVVATSHEESCAGRGREGRSSCKTPVVLLVRSWNGCQVYLLLVEIDLLVPPTPHLRRCKHTSRSAHVAKSCLAGSVSTASRDTRNTGNSTTFAGSASTLLDCKAI